MIKNRTFTNISRIYQIGYFKHYCQKVPNIQKVSKEKVVKETKGQPTYETHPHLISEGDITPFISRNEYIERRLKFLNTVAEYSKRAKPDIKQHIVKNCNNIVIPSAQKCYMSDKIPYVFRQNTDFLYLTGCQEPDSCLVLTHVNDSSSSILFLRDKDEHAEKWDGPRTGPKSGKSYFGVDQCLSMNELENFIFLFCKSYKKSMLWYDLVTPTQQKVHKLISQYHAGEKKTAWENPKYLLHGQRLIKSASEIKLMKETCNIASQAIVEAMRFSKPGISEHQLFAKVDYESRIRGAQYLAYPPVVAGGNRATYIHYINNDQIVNNGEMVLMDAGCEFGGYTSDITRTWPVSGKFTSEQKALYQIVLDTQIELINLCKEMPPLDDLFTNMCRLLGQRLQSIGLISKSLSKNEMANEAYKYCPHHVSHYLGMDVHDTALIGRNIPMRPGMVVTIEPGIYINHQFNVPERYQGLGIRIEDDILITESGPVVLTKNCPKTIEDIQQISNKGG